ncbi:MAG: PAS domain S-box protein [Desulfobacteraceae bacterium]|jgi:PAS domain S-box-containing protein|nr:PAS domain S-box protein [Desulfobacteraceae bacterium]
MTRKIPCEAFEQRIAALESQLADCRKALKQELPPSDDRPPASPSLDAVYEHMMQSALIGNYIVRDGKFIYTNPEFSKMTGYNQKELLGMPTRRLVHDDYKLYVRNSAVRMLKEKHSVPYEFCVVTKSGELKWIMETVTSIRFGGHRAALGYFMDVTQKREAENQRREKERLQNALEMAGAVCHELNNPMQGILMFCESIMDDVSEESRLHGDLKLIVDNVHRMDRTIKSLLNITRYKTKEYINNEKIFDISKASKRPT